jgi:pimeloyl-ACP methyl ester carboxylesterase
VQSRDGTRVNYLSTGSGPSLLVIPGALAAAADNTILARQLARRFTVHIVERRGRGDSGPAGPDYGIATECEDLAAVQARTGAAYLLGHSYGGLIALEFARGNRSIEGVVVYEPGVSIARSIPVDWAPACSRELAAGRSHDAFITFIQGVNPQVTGRVPRWLLKAVIPLAVRGRPRKYTLLPSAITEHLEAARLDDTYRNYREVTAPTLVMVGARSARLGPVAATAEVLTSVLPHGRLQTMPKMDHFGPEKHPGSVAAAAIDFLA